MDISGTRERIIEAAIEAFLDKGYDAATIRDICKLAGANVAAVNYHFGSKDALHAAVLENIEEACHARHPVHEGLDAPMPPGERLRLLVRNILRLNFPDDPELARRGKLFWLELGNPSPALAPMVERYMRPLKDMLESVVTGIIGPAEPETVRLCCGSIVGQTLFHAQNRAIITQLYPDKTYNPADVARLAEHITAFSLAGLEAIRARLGNAACA
jgi:AcrR family transcriptional regulator